MRNRTIAAGIVASVLLAAPQAALAQDATDDLIVADPVVDTTMVSVFGTDISLAVAVDADGNLTSVELTDGAGGAPEGAVATEVSPHEVKFVIDDAGTTIEVEVEDRKIETEVEARALTDLTGNHSWTGELFGAGNGATDIAFTVTDSTGTILAEDAILTGVTTGTTTQTVEFVLTPQDAAGGLTVTLNTPDEYDCNPHNNAIQWTPSTQ